MNEGLFGTQYGAPLRAVRMRVKIGQGASQAMFDTLVLVTADNTSPTSKSSGATVGADVTDMVIQVPVSLGRGGQSVTASGSLALQVADGTIVGGNRRGAGAIDFQTTRSAATQVASGVGSLVVGARNVVSGAYSSAIGDQNTVSASNSLAVGFNQFCNGSAYNYAFGFQCIANSTYSFAVGANSVANAQASVALGDSATARSIAGTMQFSGSARAAAGDRQTRRLIQTAVTTNATATVLTTTGGAEATNNTWVIPNNHGGVFTGWILARNTANNDQRAWRFEGMVTRDGTAASVALLGAVTPAAVGTADAGLSACVLAVGVNTTNGSMIVTATGIAATTIHWVGWIDCAENG